MNIFFRSFLALISSKQIDDKNEIISLDPHILTFRKRVQDTSEVEIYKRKILIKKKKRENTLSTKNKS